MIVVLFSNSSNVEYLTKLKKASQIFNNIPFIHANVDRHSRVVQRYQVGVDNVVAIQAGTILSIYSPSEELETWLSRWEMMSNVMGPIDLLSFIDLERSRILFCVDSAVLKPILVSGPTETKIISDDKNQLLINVFFKCPVRLQSLLISGMVKENFLLTHKYCFWQLLLSNLASL